MKKIDLKVIQSQLNEITNGFNLLVNQYGPSHLELKYSIKEDNELELTDIYLASMKFNYPQILVLKVNIQTGLITEIYPSCTGKNIEESIFYITHEISEPIICRQTNNVPYFSLSVRGPNLAIETDDLYQAYSEKEWHRIDKLYKFQLQKRYYQSKFETYKKIINVPIKIESFIDQQKPYYLLVGKDVRIDKNTILILGYSQLELNNYKIITDTILKN